MYKDIVDKRKYFSEYMRKWNLTPAGQRARTSQAVRKRCGATIFEYDEMYKEQGGSCAICKAPAPQYGDGRLHIDHDHETLKLRALLCTHCNRGLGGFKDNVSLLRAAITLLEKAS